MATKIDSLWFKIDDTWIKGEVGGGGGSGDAKYLCVPSTGRLEWTALSRDLYGATAEFDDSTSGSLVLYSGSYSSTTFNCVAMTAEGPVETQVSLSFEQSASYAFEKAYSVSLTVGGLAASTAGVSNYRLIPRNGE